MTITGVLQAALSIFKKDERPIVPVQGSLATRPIEVPVLPPASSLPDLQLSFDKFSTLTQHVIDFLEGGYYHPSMKSKFNIKSQLLLGDSGETMFGLDRKHGAQLARYPEWDIFWDVVDQGKAKRPFEWKYNAKNVKDADVLKDFAARIMYKWFSYLAGKYILISSMDEIANDDRLTIHFIYGAWNGIGWFERYAKALNAAIVKFPNQKEAIFQEAFKARIASSNPVIRQQGTNMVAMFKSLGLA